MIDVVNVWHHYGIRPVLRDVSLRVNTGEVVVIMGPNGMGKSTLLSVIAGLLSPIKGYVEVDGLRRRRTVDEELRVRQKMFYLAESPWLPGNTTGREYILAVGRLYGVEEQRLLTHGDSLLDLFDLTGQGDTPIRSYSTGQRKKIGICTALITEAPILVMDEPFSGGLDSSALLALSQIIKRVAAQDSATMLLAVPVPELVEGLADRIAIIEGGKIVAYDTVAGLRQTAGVEGPLPQVIERIVHPGTADKLARYFGEPR